MSSHIIETESFHDNYVHAMAFTNEGFEPADFELDIDHIKEWLCDETPCNFIIAPAILCFKNVSSLSVSINQEGFTMNSYLGCILEIRLTHLQNSRAVYEIIMTHDDFIKFEADASTLTYTGSEVKTTVQYLTKSERATPNPSFKRDA
jgi:hypothetical protein